MRTVILAAISALILTSGAEAHHRPGHASPLRKETLWKEMLAKETLYVYDAFEQRLGQYTSQGCFIREVDRYWVEICGLDAQGNHEYAIYFLLYSEPQCRGQAYLTTFWMMDPQHPEVSNTHGIIPGLPLVSVTGQVRALLDNLMGDALAVGRTAGRTRSA